MMTSGEALETVTKKTGAAKYGCTIIITKQKN